MMSAFKRQVGGSHYADFAIQPVYFCQKNGLGACESSIIKYACRWKKKHKNSVDDLRKIIHYAELLIEISMEDVEINDDDMFRHEHQFKTFAEELEGDLS